MTEPFLGQLMLVGFNFAPRGWTNADGQLLPISQYSALFSLYGCMYGGDCRSTFALPDLRGRVAIHTGSGPGLTPRPQGQMGGIERVTLNNTEIPSHTHTGSGTTRVTSTPATLTDPAGHVLAQEAAAGIPIYSDTTTPGQLMAAGNVQVTINNTGGGLSHDNMQPFLTLRYIVALQGIFPSRN